MTLSGLLGKSESCGKPILRLLESGTFSHRERPWQIAEPSKYLFVCLFEFISPPHNPKWIGFECKYIVQGSVWNDNFSFLRIICKSNMCTDRIFTHLWNNIRLPQSIKTRVQAQQSILLIFLSLFALPSVFPPFLLSFFPSLRAKYIQPVNQDWQPSLP